MANDWFRNFVNGSEGPITAQATSSLREDFQTAQADLERARHAGDDLAAHEAEFRVNRVLDQARERADEARKAEQPPPVDFDAGVRRTAQRAPTMTEVILAQYREKLWGGW